MTTRSILSALVGCSLTIVALGMSGASAAAAPEPPRPPSDDQRIALQSREAVVRVFDGCRADLVWQPTGAAVARTFISVGSGFFVSPDGYIVSNAHMAENTAAGAEQCRNQLLSDWITDLAKASKLDPKALSRTDIEKVLARTRVENFQQIHHIVLPSGDVLSFDVKAIGAEVGQGKDVAILKIEIKNAPTLRLGDSTRVLTLDPVMVVGYPAAADSDVLSRKSQLQASITQGSVSATKQLEGGAPVLQISAPITHGSSGGPVLNARGEVVGIVTFRGDTVNGSEVTGFAFAVPAETVGEFVSQAGVKNQEGPVDQRYRDGLDLLWSGHFTESIVKFQEVSRLYPQHSQIATLVRQAQELAITVGDPTPTVIPAPSPSSSASAIGTTQPTPGPIGMLGSRPVEPLASVAVPTEMSLIGGIVLLILLASFLVVWAGTRVRPRIG